MTEDPNVNWIQPNPFGIQLGDPKEDIWNSGHVTDVLELDQGGLVVSTQTGGVWSITPNGATISLSHGWDSPDVNCLAFGPDGNRHIYAGCKDGVIWETDSSSAFPLFSWRIISRPLPIDPGQIRRIVVLKSLRRIVVACDKGLFWSTIPLPTTSGGGYAWRKPSYQGAAPEGYFGLAWGTTNENPHSAERDSTNMTIVAGASKGGLFYGQWDRRGWLRMRRASLQDEQGGNIDIYQLGMGAISVAACTSIPNFVYAACSREDGLLLMVVRSKDGGKVWVPCETTFEGATNSDLIKQAGDQGNSWNNCIGVAPYNPASVAVAWKNGPFLSRSYGKSWQPIPDTPHIHADKHVLYFPPITPAGDQNLYVGSDGGLAMIQLGKYYSGGGQPYRSDYNRLLPTLQFYSTQFRDGQRGAFYGTSSTSSYLRGFVSGGLQDNGNAYCKMGQRPTPWSNLNPGEDGGLNLFLEGRGLIRNGNSKGVRATQGQGTGLVDAGVVLIGVPPPSVPADPDGLKIPYLTGDVVRTPKHRNAARRLMYAVAGKDHDVFGLFDGGSGNADLHWEYLGSLPLDKDAHISALGSRHGSIVLVGSSDGRIFAMDANSGSATELNVSLPKPTPLVVHNGGEFNRILVLSDTLAFATLNKTSLGQNYILRLDGLRWEPSFRSPANEIFYALEADPTQNPNTLFVATDNRVYVSRDEGNSWQSASQGLPARPHCSDLRFVTYDNLDYLYLSTYGRSMWVARLNADVGGDIYPRD